MPINRFPASRHIRVVSEFIAVVEALCAFGGISVPEYAVAAQVRANRNGVEAGPEVVHKLQNALEGVVDAGPPLEREDVPVAVVVSVVVGDVVQVVNQPIVGRLEAELPVFLADGAADDFEVDRCGPVVRLPARASRVFLLGVEVECRCGCGSCRWWPCCCLLRSIQLPRNRGSCSSHCPPLSTDGCRGRSGLADEAVAAVLPVLAPP